MGSTVVVVVRSVVVGASVVVVVLACFGRVQLVVVSADSSSSVGICGRSRDGFERGKKKSGFVCDV